ncbi:hypothetical protein J8281_03030 [Aquimarina sp. U1-2]|uniref:hypothetical protein n=1 Tax=Aquimarina sp. U1-2 TaxID=2823141 RepID=UPI001AEC8268|nr:hypothetical protein [Aquimarina sp. U1-2]MBP2831151.1 hypothetical protein [Aquimarina sp. U1-2]
MKNYFVRILSIILTLTVFSCSDGEDGIDGVDGIDGENGFNLGLEYLVFAGDITDEEALQVIANNQGNNTHTVLVLNTTNLTTLDLTEITTLINLEVSGNSSLQNLSLPNLETVLEDVEISRNDALATVNLEKLNDALDLNIEENVVLNSLNLNSVTQLDRLEIEENPILEILNLPECKAIGNLSIQSSENVSSLSVPNLQTLGNLSIRETRLSEINLPQLETIDGFFIQDNESLESVNAPLLANTTMDQGAGITIQRNMTLSTVTLGAIDKFNRVRIENNDNLTLFEANALEAITNTFTLRNNPSLTSLIFPDLLRISSLTIFESNLITLQLDALQETRTVSITENSNLTSVSLPSLTVAEAIRISENPALTTIQINELVNTDGAITISTNENLNTVSFEKLVNLNASLVISSNTALESVAFPQLASAGVPDVRTSFDIRSHPNLTRMDFSNLTTLHSTLSISTNASVPSISFPALSTITGSDTFSTIDINNNTSVTTISFPNLETTSNIRSITINEEQLATINFESLTTFSELTVDSDVPITTLNLSSAQNFSTLRLGGSRGNLSTTVIDNILTSLVNVAPPITGTRITLTGEASAQATTDAQTLRDNGNSVSIF